MVDGRVVVGIDVGKRFHHACVVDDDGQVRISRRVDNREADVLQLFAEVDAVSTESTFLIDVLSDISALIMALAAATNRDLRYVPGAAVAGLSRMFVGEGKTDARDARVIAEAGRLNAIRTSY